MDKGFKPLERFDFEDGVTREAENIVFFRRGKLPPAHRQVGEREKRNSAEEQNPAELQESLVADILEICGDEGSTNFYKKTARVMPKDAIYRTIAEVREVVDLGTIKKTKGALFTKLIREKAQKLGIEL